MSRRCIAVILSLLTALGPAATLASASPDAHCHDHVATTHASHDAAHTVDHSAHGASASGLVESTDQDCCDCSCATGNGCATFACFPAASLPLAEIAGARPDALADSDHARGRGPPPSPPPIESPLNR